MEMKESEKGVKLELPVEKFSDDEKRILDAVDKLPQLQRKLSI